MSKSTGIKAPRTRKQSAPRNVAAKALRTNALFKPKVEADPKAYTRREKHSAPIVPLDDDKSEQ